MPAWTRLSFAACAALLLSACGANPEDFAVDTKASPAEVAAALAGVNLDEAELLFGKVPVTRSKPGEGQTQWTVQSSDHLDKPGDPGIILLRLEPLENGQSTRIHVAISVPPVKMLMGQANMVLSEAKVEAEYRKLLERMAKKLDRRSGTAIEVAEMGQLIGAVAVAANPKLQARANELNRSPQLLDMFDDDGLAPDTPAEPAEPAAAEPAETPTGDEVDAESSEPLEENPA